MNPKVLVAIATSSKNENAKRNDLEYMVRETSMFILFLVGVWIILPVIYRAWFWSEVLELSSNWEGGDDIRAYPAVWTTE